MSSDSPNEQSSDEKTKKVRSSYRDFAPFLTLGFQLAAAVILFLFAGHWVDIRFEIAPFGKLIGVVIGSIGGFIKFFKTVETLTKNEKKQKSEQEV